MNWLDKAIGWVAPETGLRRARARAANQALLAYEAVRSPRRQGGWLPSGASGNAEVGAAVSKLRDSARDLARNNAYARRALREWSKRVVGTGMTPRPMTGSVAVDKAIAAAWNSWSRECCSDRRMNFGALQKMLVRARFESGEVLVRLWNRLPGDGLTVPFQVQPLEADFLDTARTMQTDSGYIIHGVQFDGIGRIQGYWLYGAHPGDVVITTARGLASKLVPAKDVLHYAEVERPGDVRAVTPFAAVINKLRDIDEYADAEIVRKKIEACMVGAVTQAEGPDGPTQGPVVTDAAGQRVETFQPGMMMYGSPGTEVKFFSPTGNGDFAQHKKTELREVAVGLDIPYVLLDDNLEAVNYSSYRGGLLAYRDAVEEHRWNWFVPQVLEPIYRRFIDTLVLMGTIPEADYAVEWDAPAFDLLDRAAEAEADRIELQIGASTWPQVVARHGADPEAQIAEIERWKPRLEAAGVTAAKSTTEGGSGGNSTAS